MFLDEPTSGLDSTAALEVVNILDKITALGMTIVAVVHQPRVEIFEKFHDVLMICPGGRTAYLGPTKDAKPYFEALGYKFNPTSNPADVLMDILSGKGTNDKKLSVDDLALLWKNKSDANSDVAAAVSKPDAEDFYSVVPALTKERGAKWFVKVTQVEAAILLSQSVNNPAKQGPSCIGSRGLCGLPGRLRYGFCRHWCNKLVQWRPHHTVPSAVTWSARVVVASARFSNLPVCRFGSRTLRCQSLCRRENNILEGIIGGAFS
jgi:ABC-2 type transporter